MSVFEDLTEYTYFSEFARRGTKNVGWIGATSDFEVASHPDHVLETVWTMCGISVAQTRGYHLCPFCRKYSGNRCKRGPDSLLLGTSEIRVFSKSGDIYAAPTLIYHYMAVHHYRPPDEFLKALTDGSTPPDDTYFAKLQALQLSWNKTSRPSPEGPFRDIKLPDGTFVRIFIDDDEVHEIREDY